MRGNRPARERFEFSLDARQVASVILGALAALGITFFLGYSLGQRVLERPASPAPRVAPAPGDPLAALDHPPRPDGGEPAPKLSFHETLTASKPPASDKLPAPPKASPAPAPAPDVAAAARVAATAAPKVGAVPPSAAVPPTEAAPAPAPLPTPVAGAKPPDAKPTVAKGAATAPGGARPDEKALPPAPRPPAPPPSPPPQAAARDGAFAVQVGSTQDRLEAERLAARLRARGARVVASEVPGRGRWYRVKVGSYETREAADQALRDLERAGTKGFVTNAN